MRKIKPDDGEFLIEAVKSLGVKPQIYKWNGAKGSGAKVKVPAFEFEYHRDPPPDPVAEKARRAIEDNLARRGTATRSEEH